jgi:hypothetical protein
MFLRSIALAAVGAACFATAAVAGNFVVTNTTSKNVHHLYLSDSSDDHWGQDQLGSGHDDVIPADTGKFTLQNIPDGTYDVKIGMEDGTECVAKGVEFEGDMVLKIDDDLLASC